MQSQEVLPMPAAVAPPVINGLAALAEAVQEGMGREVLAALLERRTDGPERAAQLLDLALLHRLQHQPERADALEAEALALSPLFRVDRAAAPAMLRVLAVMAPGDLMVNTPLDFITAHLPVQLDLLYVQPGVALPCEVPAHDVAFFAVSESDPQALARLAPLYAAWPMPAVNDPARTALLSRDGLPALLAGIDGLCCPPAHAVKRDEAQAALARLGCEAVIRPLGSHAGRDLALVDGAAALAVYLTAVPDAAFFLSPFADYAGPDGLFRKLRLVMIGGAAFLCHFAVSSHWIVHYMSAGMAENAERRAEEAAAMAGFDAGFVARHRGALAEMQARIGLDYYQIDCAELPDGRLLVFEADVAAIIHLLDPPALFPYKPAQMRRVFTAFGRMLQRRARSEG